MSSRLEDICSLIKEAEDESNHLLDRIEAYMNLGFIYGSDYHMAYRAFNKARDLLTTKREV